MGKSGKLISGGLGILFIIGVLSWNFSEQPSSEDHQEAIIPVLPPRPNPFVQQLLAQYEEEILKLQSKTRTPGVAIAIVSDTTTLYLNAIGLKTAGTSDSLDVHSVFRLASVSKCFAPVLTGLLVEDGLLAWDDPVVKYVPGFALKSKSHTDSLTLRHVLSHTTGLPYHTYTTLVEDGVDLSFMLEKLRDIDLIGKPGEVYSYQNVAYSVIAEVIRAVTGKSYEQLMYERIFIPLHMRDASISYDSIMANPNVAQPHLLWRKGWKPTTIKNTYYNVAPAGGINASIADMAQWLKALLGTRPEFIDASTLNEIYAPAVRAKSKNRNFRKWIDRADSHYAMGWRVLNFREDTLLYHGGYVRGYRSEIAIDRNNRIGICVLTNGPGKLVDNSVPIFFSMYFNQRDSIWQWDVEERIRTGAPVVKR